MCDLAAFGDTIKEAQARVGALSERIDALSASYSQRNEFQKDNNFVKRRRDESVQSYKSPTKNFIKINTYKAAQYSAQEKN